MLLSQKWEKQRVEPQSFQKIWTVPLPSQPANKILQDLQSSCNSSNKVTQTEALKCWEAWITSHNPNDWALDSVCQFAIKPLLTKKLHSLHKDGDICKLKLNIMWKLMTNVQTKMGLNGPQCILESFINSSFIWLSSISNLDNDVSILILKLLLSLFNNSKEIIECDKYVFPPISMDVYILEKMFLNFVDKFLDTLDNWKKINNNNLVMSLWAMLLDRCEFYHDSIATPIWHRIFRINQTFCSDKSESIKSRLAFLHACSTVSSGSLTPGRLLTNQCLIISNVKAVLLSSKYIGGESCFMTPCEAMLKKFVEICNVDCEESPDREIFATCEEICKVLTYRSIETCQYDLCIYLLDSFDDFALKSCSWGSWCGLVHCFKKTLLGHETKHFTKNQMKFYRKLRATTVNFELDKIYLDKESVITVYSNIRILDIGCICAVNILSSHQANAVPSLSSDDKKPSEDTFHDVCPSKELVPISLNSQKAQLIPFNSNFDEKSIYVTFGFDSGRFGSVALHTRQNSKLKTLSFDIEKLAGIFETMPSATKKLLLNGLLNVNFSRLKFKISGHTPAAVSKKYICSSKASSPTKTFNHERRVAKVCVSNVRQDVTPKRITKSTSRQSRVSTSSEKENTVAWINENNVDPSPRTRSRKKEQEKRENVNNKKKRKSFEVLVQEIVKRNKLRKTVRNSNENSSETPFKRELRKRRKTESPKTEQKKHVPKKVRAKNTQKTQMLQKSSKEEEKACKAATDGRLDNFFKVISTFGSEKKEESPKLGKVTKQKRGKKMKGTVTWKQTSLLKTMVRETEENEIEKMQLKQEVKIEIRKEDIVKLSPFKEVLHDHEYAKIVQTPEMTLGKHLKKEVPELEVNNELQNTALPNEVENSKKLQEAVPHENHGTENTEVYELENVTEYEEKFNVLGVSNRGSEVVASQMPDNVQDESTIKVKVEAVEFNVEKQTDAQFEAQMENASTVSLGRGKKRIRHNDGSTEKESKKIRLEVKEEADTPLQDHEKENLEVEPESCKNEVVSQSNSMSCVKMESLTNEISDFQPKTESPPHEQSKSAKVANRSISSRALKMIALVPDSNLHGSQSSWDLSPKLDQKARGKKFIGVDRSSRVSKMLANLSKSMPRVTEDSATDDKTSSELHGFTTPTANSPVSKLMSPRSGKKKKFISFDETKNETVIYRTDTPPSQVMSEWERMKEDFCSPEKEAEVEAQVDTPPSHHLRFRRKLKDGFDVPEKLTESLDNVPTIT